MASTKRVTGDYNIYADNTIINGNLTVVGIQTSVESVDTVIKDRIVTLNSGETGEGVTLTYSGIEVDRGSLDKTAIRWNELTLSWQLTNDGTNYSSISTVTGSTVASGSNRNVQFNNSGVLTGEDNFSYYANGNVALGTTLIANNSTISTTSNNDLNLIANGTGKLYLQNTVKLKYQTGTTPVNVSNTVQVLANTPAGGGTGIYFVNSNGSDELISKTKATVLALIFS
jgi:hypothetical protein